jgi:two-component system sensor histidine kinase UhpB
MLELQRDVASTLAGIGDCDAAARAILLACLTIDGIDSGGVYLVEERSGDVVLAAHAGLSEDFISAVGRFPAGSPQMRLVSDHLVFASPYTESGFALDRVRHAEGLRGIGIVGLRCDCRLVGVLNVASHSHEHLSGAALATVTAIAAVSSSTLRRLALEASHRERERDLAGLFDAAGDLLFVVEPGAGFLYVNRAVERRLGYTRAELATMAVTDVYAPEHRAEAVRVLTAMWRGDEKFCTIPLRARDGRPVPVEIAVSEGRWGGRPALFGISRDLSARHEYERRVSESERQYRALFETMVQGVVYQDADGRIIGANPAAERILGLSLDELRRRTSADPRWLATRADGSPFPGDEHPTMVALQTGKPVRDVIMGVYAPADDARRWILVNAMPEVPDDAQRPRRVFATFTDITEAKRAEGALRKARDDLQRLAGHLLTVAEEERKAVAREIHDELGQVVTAMKLDVEWLRVRISDHSDTVKEKVDALSAVVDRTLATVRDLARRLRPAMLDDLGLVPAIRWLVDDFEHHANARVRLRLPSDALTVPDGVGIAVFRMVQEALTNIARHAQASRAEVTLRASRRTLTVTVRDDGKGLPRELAAEPGAWGLLGMVERVTSLGGTFATGSATGGGTELRATFPLAPAEPTGSRSRTTTRPRSRRP